MPDQNEVQYLFLKIAIVNSFSKQSFIFDKLNLFLYKIVSSPTNKMKLNLKWINRCVLSLFSSIFLMLSLQCTEPHLCDHYIPIWMLCTDLFKNYPPPCGAGNSRKCPTLGACWVCSWIVHKAAELKFKLSNDPRNK